MFASGTGSMRGPRVKTPLLLLLLLAALTKTVLCDDGDAAAVDEAGATETLKEEAAEVVHPGADGGGGGTEISETIPTTTDDSPTAAPDPSLADENMLFPVESPVEDDHGSGLSLASLDHVPTDATPGPYSTGPRNITSQGVEEGLSLIIILIPVVLVVLIIGMIVCGIFINRRWNEKARNQVHLETPGEPVLQRESLQWASVVTDTKRCKDSRCCRTGSPGVSRCTLRKKKLHRITHHEELRKEDPYLDGSSTEKVPMPMFEEDVPSVLELEMEELDQWMKNDGETAKDSTLA